MADVVCLCLLVVKTFANAGDVLSLWLGGVEMKVGWVMSGERGGILGGDGGGVRPYHPRDELEHRALRFVALDLPVAHIGGRRGVHDQPLRQDREGLVAQALLDFL